ncbi:mobile element protein [Geminocystis sp. NIES-3708]|uniref:TniB family NTP-binding protein n=1 Tax=Geminocystis sp. NIES-3708 TaxID=1615909 RepID=UPI0005FC861F|nr:TniB family NTP-binding protein [Geminocystis sp. NIES-3708]BAQ61912.1 mobile element protein [Geminocystis sp. NIES-3708]
MEAKAIAQQLGNIEIPEEKLQMEITRLNGKTLVSLEQVAKLHEYFEGKRQSKQSCRVVGESRTGKTMACDSYRLRHKPIQKVGHPPQVPVVYIQIPQDCGTKELFQSIIEYLKYQMTKGTIAEIRQRAIKVLQGCGVEMIIIDEADRFKPKTFAEVKDIFDRLNIPIVLVGTDRLDTVIKRDEQVYNRFRSCYRFGKLSGADFQNTVNIWEKQVLKLLVASNLTQTKMLKLIAEATGGYIGLMDTILRESAIRSLKRGFNKITFEMLKEVTQEFK